MECLEKANLKKSLLDGEKMLKRFKGHSGKCCSRDSQGKT